MIRVAICDDDIPFTGYFENLIKQASSNLGIVSIIELFFDGETLLKNISSGSRYDLIFMDINMERLDGISAARYIREIDKTVLLIYSSGYDQYLKELFEVEPFRFLSKPIDDNFLYDILQRPVIVLLYQMIIFNSPLIKQSKKLLYVTYYSLKVEIELLIYL
ncbi:MAG: response regulator [Anaerocolumna sp.]